MGLWFKLWLCGCGSASDSVAVFLLWLWLFGSDSDSDSDCGWLWFVAKLCSLWFGLELLKNKSFLMRGVWFKRSTTTNKDFLSFDAVYEFVFLNDHVYHFTKRFITSTGDPLVFKQSFLRPSSPSPSPSPSFPPPFPPPPKQAQKTTRVTSIFSISNSRF